LGSKTNEPLYDGYLRVGYCQQVDPSHPLTFTLGKSTATVAFDLGDLPRSHIIDSAILYVDHIERTGTPPDVYGTNRKAVNPNPSDILGVSLPLFSQLGGPFKDEAIILDVTNIMDNIQWNGFV
jgi:hypothetical protein